MGQLYCKGVAVQNVGEVAVQICHYFKDFLETDFKRQQAPRRRIQLQADSGFRTGMRTRPYESLDRDLWNLLNRPSAEPLQLKLTPRKYTRALAPVLQKVIEEQIAVIEQAAVDRVHQATIHHISSTFSKAIEDLEKWVDNTDEQLRSAVSTHLVRPLIARLDGPLQRSAYSVIDSLYSAEVDMVDAVAAEIRQQLPAVLARHSARRNDAEIAESLATFLTLSGTQQALRTYFESFIVADAFMEFRDIETYASITEEVQLYLYLGSVRFRNVQYPLFFVPVQVDKLADGSGYQLTLINQLFANRAAIDFVLAELAAARTREWVSPIQERINYLAPQQSIYEVAHSLFGMVANALDLAGQIQLGSSAAEASTADVSLSAVLHLCAFERGEEALVNDYEELIDLAKKGGSQIVTLFEDLVDGMLNKNPVSITKAVEAEWDELSLPDRLVFDSPIPLNEEQRKILLAVRRPEGRIIVVEGPPGTGKSHTITAIAADCAFSQRSCLILSDKKEALEVVQDKLSEAMNRVRHDRDFPNPLLRLGRQDANFKKLVANQTVSQVAAYVKATRANAPRLDAERKDTSAQLKQDIDGTVSTLGAITIKRLQELHATEAQISHVLPRTREWLLGLAERPALASAANNVKAAGDVLVAYLQGLKDAGDLLANSLATRLKRDACVQRFARENDPAALATFGTFNQLEFDDVRTLARLLLEYRQLKMPVFGYLFRGGAVRQLDKSLNELPARRVLQLKQDAPTLEVLVRAANELHALLEIAGQSAGFALAYRQIVHGLPNDTAVDALSGLVAATPHDAPLLEELCAADPKAWPAAVSFIADWLEVQGSFARAPEYDYVGTKGQLERLNTQVMNTHVDSRLVDFMETHRADAKTLAQLIAERQKFPEDRFDAVRKSFPIIIASIREFGEYMPLVDELFDVVVIDEASQVSVAQALPAILRAKKVVVLGDSKQFANVKSSNASIALNDKYRANLVQFFERNVQRDAAALQRLAMFDVKRSILEFCSLGASYSIMLRKHFRSYPELISLSSTYFYNRQLQAIKVRGVPLEDVIRFDQVDADGHKVSRTSNIVEADYIATRLVELLELTNPPTVGVITPFREQHTLLTKLLFGHALGREFEDKLRLKVMTFDSCQGEERNIIFYSMVATVGSDALNYVFPVDLDSAADGIEEKLKVQRLNVGFSRAQEMIWFVHSMPLESFRGSIGKALNHYAQVLRRKHGEVSQTDVASPMEAQVLGWLQATRFVQAQPDVEILPQFPIGEYLRQLDPTYDHPSWRVDFLLTCRTSRGLVRVVIEYDGFEFHFQQNANVHIGNHQRYLNPEDVERQLTLESYGYRFLRINRFNLGKDPIATLDGRLAKLVEISTGEQTSQVLERLQQQAAGMANREMRQCSRCNEIKPLDGFYDPSLKDGAGGHGRVCLACKRQDGSAVRKRRQDGPHVQHELIQESLFNVDRSSSRGGEK